MRNKYVVYRVFNSNIVQRVQPTHLNLNELIFWSPTFTHREMVREKKIKSLREKEKNVVYDSERKLLI